MEREFVGVSESDTVGAAAALMLDEEVECVAVVRGGRPVGSMTARDALGVVVGGADPDEVLVGDVMDDPAPQVEAGETVEEARDRLMAESAPRLFVVDDGELVGLVSERDLLSATETAEVTLANGGVGGVGAEVEEERAENRTTTEEYSNQSICEVCGTLSRTLSNVNGQLVCSDCRDI